MDKNAPAIREVVSLNSVDKFYVPLSDGWEGNVPTYYKSKSEGIKCIKIPFFITEYYKMPLCVCCKPQPQFIMNIVEVQT